MVWMRHGSYHASLRVSNSIGMQPIHYVRAPHDADDRRNSCFCLTSHSGLLGSMERGGPDVSQSHRELFCAD